MYKDENIKIYFASPFFNEEQVEREERLKKELRRLGFEVFSPKEESLLKKDSTLCEQQKTFDCNINNIDDCDIIFGVTDGKDMGTIWECGYANGLNRTRKKHIIIVYYCETLGNGKFNLMLARSADVVITRFEELKNIKKLIKKGNCYEGFIE